MTGTMRYATLLFNRRWWWKTLIVLLAMAFMSGLGVWQLDRLEQRRAANVELAAKLASEVLVVDGSPLDESPAALRNRKATVQGEYDYAQQIAIKNESHQGQPGVHLFTPLRIEGSDRAILVNRGWVAYQQGTPEEWGQFDEQANEPLTGYLQPSRKMPDGSTTQRTEAFQQEWFRADIEAIQAQVPYELLPVYLMLSPESGRMPSDRPVRVVPDLSIDEGSHLGYALQWFSFALIAGLVYLGVIRRQESGSEGKK
jgi:surfeit locus 1 family protein